MISDRQKIAMSQIDMLRYRGCFLCLWMFRRFLSIFFVVGWSLERLFFNNFFFSDKKNGDPEKIKTDVDDNTRSAVSYFGFEPEVWHPWWYITSL